MFTRFRPLRPEPDAGAEKSPQKEALLKEDFRKSRRIEKYRIGAAAVYIPAGFAWKYLLLKDIQKVIRGRWFIQSDNGVAPFAMEAPAIRLRFPDGEEILQLEKKKNAESVLALLEKGIPEAFPD